MGATVGSLLTCNNNCEKDDLRVEFEIKLSDLRCDIKTLRNEVHSLTQSLILLNSPK